MSITDNSEVLFTRYRLTNFCGYNTSEYYLYLANDIDHDELISRNLLGLKAISGISMYNMSDKLSGVARLIIASFNHYDKLICVISDCAELDNLLRLKKYDVYKLDEFTRRQAILSTLGRLTSGVYIGDRPTQKDIIDAIVSIKGNIYGNYGNNYRA